MEFFGWLSRGFMEFSSPGPRFFDAFKEFRGFPGMELGIFRVAESSGEGRNFPARIGDRNLRRDPFNHLARAFNGGL